MTAGLKFFKALKKTSDYRLVGKSIIIESTSGSEMHIKGITLMVPIKPVL